MEQSMFESLINEYTFFEKYFKRRPSVLLMNAQCKRAYTDEMELFPVYHNGHRVYNKGTCYFKDIPIRHHKSREFRFK